MPSQSGDWLDPLNWGGTLPTGTDAAYIANGGTANVTSIGPICGTLSLGGSAGSGSVDMTDGSLSAGWQYVGDSGAGTFTQSGGTNSGNIDIGNASGGSGTYNLIGGLLVTSSLSQGSGTAAFNFSGGTLQASSGFSTSLPMALGRTGGGATIDSASSMVTFSGPLSGPGSLTKIDSGTLVLTGSNTYTGATTISGGILKVTNTLALGSGAVMLTGGTLSLATPAPSSSIGIQFVGDGKPVTGPAGVVPMSNWNSLSGMSFSNVGIPAFGCMELWVYLGLCPRPRDFVRHNSDVQRVDGKRECP
ncbi:MAG: autotransporter-associated beta strand repeat-containing protein, partial [Thermoguttaceae bacterium]